MVWRKHIFLIKTVILNFTCESSYSSQTVLTSQVHISLPSHTARKKLTRGTTICRHQNYLHNSSSNWNNHKSCLCRGDSNSSAYVSCQGNLQNLVLYVMGILRPGFGFISQTASTKQLKIYHHKRNTHSYQRFIYSLVDLQHIFSTQSAMHQGLLQSLLIFACNILMLQKSTITSTRTLFRFIKPYVTFHCVSYSSICC